MTSLWQHRAVLAAFAIALVVSLPAQAFAQAAHEDAPIQQDGTDRVRLFFDTTVLSPLFYLQVAGAGVLDKLAGFPEEWPGAGGYAHANVARFEQMLLGEAIGQGVAAALNHEVGYARCTCHGALPRTGHALAGIFVSKHVDGHNAPNISRWVGLYGSAAIADFWYPASYTKKSILLQATAGLGLGGGVNILKEFLFK